MDNYENMTTDDILYQLEWSDPNEFSYNYSMWAFKELENLKNIINEIDRIVHNEKVSGIESKLIIKDILEKVGVNDG